VSARSRSASARSPQSSLFCVIPGNYHHGSTGVSGNYSAQSKILPFTDQASLHNLINFDNILTEGCCPGNLLPPNDVAAATPLSIFKCPSDAGPELYDVTAGARSPFPGRIEKYAANNYHINNGTGVGTLYDTRRPTDGIVWIDAKVKFAHITDGLSNTMAFSESLRGDPIQSRPAPTNRRERRTRMMNLTCAFNQPGLNPATPGMGSFAPTDQETLETHAQGTGLLRGWTGQRGAGWINGREYWTGYFHFHTPNRVVSENSLWSEDAPPANNTPTAVETSEERRRSAAMFARLTLYGIAVVDGSIVFRTGSQVYCVRSQDTAADLSK
jgi:hypothetical protein